MIASFKKGFVDALPILFGYLAVGFAFGCLAYKYGHPVWSPLLMSATHISGTGQFAVVDLLHFGSSFVAITVAVLVLNLRYVLMALSIAQRLPENFGMLKRIFVALGDTDEIVAVAIKQRHELTFQYLMGLLSSSWIGWFGGTLLGANSFTQGLLPERLTSALGIALYAMFLAIIIPEARRRCPVTLAVCVAAVLSISLRLLFTSLDGGWIMLISGLVSAVLAAIIFPKKEAQGE